jgi:hypothetical protein
MSPQRVAFIERDVDLGLQHVATEEVCVHVRPALDVLAKLRGGVVRLIRGEVQKVRASMNAKTRGHVPAARAP